MMPIDRCNFQAGMRQMAALDAVTIARMQNTMEALQKRENPSAVYLFGSRFNGTADQWSDYDLTLLLYGAENWTMKMLVRFCVDVQKEVGDDIELHVFPGSQAQNPEASFPSFPNFHLGMHWDLKFPFQAIANCGIEMLRFPK